MKSEIRRRVHRTDVDPTGIIDFSAYARFIEIAEDELYRDLGFRPNDFTRMGVSLPRVHLEFQFYKPVLLDDELVLQTSVRGVGVHSVRLQIDVMRLGEEAQIAEAMVVVSCTDLAHKSAPLPEEFVAALRARLVPAG
jgi:YbgC/YbaW family acyl-CoA thioester hydrolase